LVAVLLALCVLVALPSPTAAQKSPYKSVVKGDIPSPTIPPGCNYSVA
jgi:hypothetical protein